MAVVNGSDAAFAVVLDAVHRIATEAERRDGAAVGAPEIVRREPLDVELGADRAHGAVQIPNRAVARARDHEAGRLAVAQLVDNLPRRRGQPHPMALLVLRAGPAGLAIRGARHLPPSV